MQIYYCSLILVHLNRPCPGGTASHLARQRNFRKWANIVCGIAQSSGDYGSSVMSTQCAFIGKATPQISPSLLCAPLPSKLLTWWLQ